jgi:hypothetical protein
MNFLELVQSLHSETGASGQVPGDVTGQTNENRQLVNWTRSAWQMIQSMRLWRFLRSEKVIATVIGQADYLLATLPIPWTDFRELDVVDTNARYSRVILTRSNGSKQRLQYLPYEAFLDAFALSPASSTTPTAFTFTPGNLALRFYPTPDKVYSINIPYFKQAQVLTAKTDTPLMDAELHWVIVWRALMLYADHNNIADFRMNAKAKYRQELSKMIERYEPVFEVAGEPLA